MVALTITSPHTAPLPSQVQETAAVVDILENLPTSPTRTHFCYKVLERTISALLEKQYSQFDAHTTSNCCQGMALLVQDLILAIRQEDLKELLTQITIHLHTPSADPTWEVPCTLIQLAQLYILHHIRDIAPRTIRSAPKTLRALAPLEGAFCISFVKILQKKYSNLVAARYEQYVNQLSACTTTCGLPTELWGKYISHPYVRSDDHGVLYAASLYAVQVVLAHQIHARYKIAIVNDMLDHTGAMHRYVRILEGDGTGNFSLIEPRAYNDRLDADEPLIVFAGCAKTDNIEQVTSDLNTWLHRFPYLALAHELTYPQFPKVNETFNSKAIVPEEVELQNLMIEYGQVTGVSSKNPHFFCLAHIYTTSSHQLLNNASPDPYCLRILTASLID